MRNTDIFDLDFTAPAAVQELADQLIYSAHVEAAGNMAGKAVQELQEALEKECKDESAWRLLGSLYIGLDRIKELNALEEKHRDIFGTNIFTIPQQRRVQRTPARKLFDMPARLSAGSLPKAEEIAAAFAASDGVEFDFSRVRGADAGGLNELKEMLSRLPRDRRPHLLGIETFIDALLNAASSPSGTKLMWQVLFEYHRFTGNEATLRDLMAGFRAKFPS